ncbi:MAG: 3-isopropylmalate dehydrogenase, partial [Actinocrinis sp.]
MVSSTASSDTASVETPAATGAANPLINLAVIGGDGIGPEVTAEALKALRAALP